MVVWRDNFCPGPARTREFVSYTHARAAKWAEKLFSFFAVRKRYYISLVAALGAHSWFYYHFLQHFRQAALSGRRRNFFFNYPVCDIVIMV